MLSTNKNVLPNFVKTLLIASLASASVSAFADDHGHAKDKMPELKEMKANSTTLKAEELSDDLDQNAVKSELHNEAKKMMDEKTSDTTSMTKKAKPEM